MTASAHQRALFSGRVQEHERLVNGYAGVWELWRTRLLAIGGTDVVPPVEPDVHIVTLIKEASTRGGEGAHRSPGRRSRCHENVAELLAAGETREGTTIAAGWTGYALSDDGLWRQHSWASAPDGTIVETTAPRLAYAGFPFA